MRHRIRASALIPQDGRILLVEGWDDIDGLYYSPPGGGLNAADSSVLDCVRRETFEETGLTLGALKLVYWREFLQLRSDKLNLELYFLAQDFNGQPTLANLKEKENIKGLRWFNRQELTSVKYFPAVLGSDFWVHLEQGFPEVLYLGREQG